MSDPSSSTSSPPPGGVSRFVGVGLSLIIGFVTFTIGVSLFPVEPPRPPTPPPRAPIAAPPVAPSASPPAASSSDAGGDAGRSTDGVDGSAGGGSDVREGNPSAADGAASAALPAKAPAARRSKTSPPRDKEKEPADASADEEPTTGAGGESGEGGATTASGDDADGGTPVAPPADCTLSDKDIAREAWRHNWPTICPIPDSGKAFILIPFKGSLESTVAELKRKPVREARVTVSSGESLLTLKLYKLRHLGFKDLKIGPGDDGTGTRFRVRLMNGAGDPVFDVKDGYAKITVASPPE